MLEVVEKDLFGNEAGTLSAAEFSTVSFLLENQNEMVSRAAWCFDNLPKYDWVLLDVEDAILLNDALLAYIFGLYGAVIIAADGFCERLLTDLIESNGDRRSARRGFGGVLAAVEEMDLFDPFVLNRISRLHALRNNLCHEKGPDSPLRLFRRSLNERQHHEDLMKRDAQEALCIARGIAMQIKRSFPRLGMPGTAITEENLI